MARTRRVPPWDDLSHELQAQIAQAFARLPLGQAESQRESIQTVRSASLAWLTGKNATTGHEHLTLHEPWTNNGNGTIAAGTNHAASFVRPDRATWAWMMNPNHRCEMWHNHTDIGADRGSPWLRANDIAALGCPGMHVVGALNAVGARCAVRIRTHRNLTAGKLLTWLTLVDETARHIIEQHQRAGTGRDIEPAEAVARVGAEAGLYTIVVEPSRLRRADLVSEILSHPAVANAPPAQHQKDTPYAAPNGATQPHLGPAADGTRSPGVTW